jgi:F0F1-type ATP synthase membrane subunit b/b'
MTSPRPIPIDAARLSLQDEIARLRQDAERRYTEMDLLVAALNDHIADLRAERDRLVDDLRRARAELDALREESSLLREAWFLRGHKGVRGSASR